MSAYTGLGLSYFGQLDKNDILYKRDYWLISLFLFYDKPDGLLIYKKYVCTISSHIYNVNRQNAIDTRICW